MVIPSRTMSVCEPNKTAERLWSRTRVHLYWHLQTGSGTTILAVNTMSPKQLERVRNICLKLPETSERLSHGEPTFFVKNKVFVMFANNHHNDGHIAVWLPVPSGFQSTLIENAPQTFFKPPYVGVRGWVGIELDQINDQDLTYHIQVAWELIAPKRLLANVKSHDDSATPSGTK